MRYWVKYFIFTHLIVKLGMDIMKNSLEITELINSRQDLNPGILVPD